MKFIYLCLSNLYLVSRADFHEQLHLLKTTKTVKFFGSHLLLGVSKLKVEMVENQRDDESYIYLCESFAETNALTT